MEALVPVDTSKLSRNDSKESLTLLIFMTDKRDGSVKG